MPARHLGNTHIRGLQGTSKLTFDQCIGPDNCAPLRTTLFYPGWCEKAADAGAGKAFRMEFGGNYLLAAPREAVWAALNDAEKLKAAIPGCRRLAWTGPTGLELDVAVNFGLLHPVFSGDLVLSDVVPAVSYRLAGRGRGGLLGLAHAAADITLADRPGGTALHFVAEGGASGQIMRLGRSIIGSSAQQVIDGFFERFAAAMGCTITALGPGD
jgi:carbon monoxide dehydrogenase subunit G